LVVEVEVDPKVTHQQIGDQPQVDQAVVVNIIMDFIQEHQELQDKVMLVVMAGVVLVATVVVAVEPLKQDSLLPVVMVVTDILG
jgi:hypothetical protein